MFYFLLKGQAEGQAEGEKCQQKSSSQKELRETVELQQVDQEGEEDPTVTEGANRPRWGRL